MAYLLVNMEGKGAHICDENEWLAFIAYAKDEGWVPSGTEYDIMFNMDESFDVNIDEEMHCLFMRLMEQNSYAEWDGSYTAKANQIFTEEDIGNLLFEVMDPGPFGELFAFIEQGSFRITDALQLKKA